MTAGPQHIEGCVLTPQGWRLGHVAIEGGRISEVRGRVVPGAWADLAVFDDALAMRRVVLEGEVLELSA